MFRRAVAADPDDARTLGNFAGFLTRERAAHDEAEALFRRSLALSPESRFVLHRLAMLLSDVRGAHDEAEALFRRAVDLDPDDGESPRPRRIGSSQPRAQSPCSRLVRTKRILARHEIQMKFVGGSPLPPWKQREGWVCGRFMPTPGRPWRVRLAAIRELTARCVLWPVRRPADMLDIVDCRAIRHLTRMGSGMSTLVPNKTGYSKSSSSSNSPTPNITGTPRRHYRR